MNNIREVFVSEGIDFKKVEVKYGRVFVRINRVREVMEVFMRVFGIVLFLLVMEVDVEFEKINKIVFKFFRKKKREFNFEKLKFRVIVRRIIKEFLLKSFEIQVKVGEYIFENEESEVNLYEYDIEVGVELMEGKVYIFVDKIRVWGGFLIGMQGKVVVLFSGGIDLLVVVFLMMKCGVEVILVYIYMGEKIFEKVCKIWNQFKKYYYGGKVEFIVVKLQNREEMLKKIKEFGKEKYICVLCKFMMVKYVDRIVKEFGVKGIVMGDLFGQVVSQIFENMYIVSQVSDLFIYCLFIGFDKEEIVDIVKKIGMFEFLIFFEDEILFIFKYFVIRGLWEEFRKIYMVIFGEELRKWDC